MAKGEYLGEFEQLVLLALVRLQAEAYGMPIRREIEQRTGRTVSIGAVYATLERMETKGLVTSAWSEATDERGGRAKRVYTLTAEGADAMRRSQDALDRMRQGVDFRKLGWKA